MSAPRASIDVSGLPDHAMGHHDTGWWGTMGFILIEAMSLAIAIAAYFYLSRNSPAWPPARTPLPDLEVATANLGIVLLSTIPAARAAIAARRDDEAATRRWLVISSIVTTLVLALRFVALQQLEVRWDTHAYGSVVWGVMVTHTTLVLTDWGDTLVLTAIFLRKKVEPKHMAGAVDNAMYWWFVVASWVVVYLVVFVAPRVL